MRGGARRKPTLETGVRSRGRKGVIEKAIIGTLALGGMLTIAMMAPKVLSVIKREHLDYVLPQDPKQRLRETISRMKRKSLITFKEIHGKRYPRLTTLGRQQIERVSLGELTIHKPFRWDRRWRMVIFDIEESRQNDRKKIRRLLQRLGFLQLQRSVWIHPYDCEEIIALIKTDMRIGRNVLYIIADAIEHDRHLRKHFDLPEDN